MFAILLDQEKSIQREKKGKESQIPSKNHKRGLTIPFNELPGKEWWEEKWGSIMM